MGVVNLDSRVKALEETSESLGSSVDQIDAALTAVLPDDKTLVLQSSTASSTKLFAITVDDDGLITATEITNS